MYEQRRILLLGEKTPATEHLSEYEARAKELDDEDYKKLEVQAVAVKDIQNTPLGGPRLLVPCHVGSWCNLKTYPRERSSYPHASLRYLM